MPHQEKTNLDPTPAQFASWLSEDLNPSFSSPTVHLTTTSHWHILVFTQHIQQEPSIMQL